MDHGRAIVVGNVHCAPSVTPPVLLGMKRLRLSLAFIETVKQQELSSALVRLGWCWSEETLILTLKSDRDTLHCVR